MAQCATTALAGAVPRPCVRGACGWFGGFGPVPGVVSLPFPASRPACPALRVAGCPVRVSPTLARWYAIPRGLCVPRARSGCPSGSPRVPFACLCARAPAASAPPPWVVWRAHLARSRHWALVGPFHVVRAPPRVLPRSLAPSGVLGGGRSGRGSPLLGFGLWGWRKGVPGGGAFHFCEGRLGSGAPPPPTARPLGGLLRSATHVLWARACGCGGPTLSPWPARPVGAACRGGGGGPSPYLAWGCAPPVGWVRGVPVPAGRLRGGGGGPCAVHPVCVAGGGLWGGGSLCLAPSLCLPWAVNKACVTGVVLVMWGVAPHTTPVCARPPSLGAFCAASWRVGAGSLVPRGSCGSRRLGQGAGPCSGSPSGRGRGDHPPCLGGWGPGPPRLAGQWGGWGGEGSRRGLPAPPLGGGPRFPTLARLLSSAHSPPGVRVPSGSRGYPGGGGG